jgi:hypothetical protein
MYSLTMRALSNCILACRLSMCVYATGSVVGKDIVTIPAPSGRSTTPQIHLGCFSQEIFAAPLNVHQSQANRKRLRFNFPLPTKKGRIELSDAQEATAKLWHVQLWHYPDTHHRYIDCNVGDDWEVDDEDEEDSDDEDGDDDDSDEDEDGDEAPAASRGSSNLPPAADLCLGSLQFVAPNRPLWWARGDGSYVLVFVDKVDAAGRVHVAQGGDKSFVASRSELFLTNPTLVHVASPAKPSGAAAAAVAPTRASPAANPTLDQGMMDDSDEEESPEMCPGRCGQKATQDQCCDRKGHLFRTCSECTACPECWDDDAWAFHEDASIASDDSRDQEDQPSEAVAGLLQGAFLIV